MWHTTDGEHLMMDLLVNHSRSEKRTLAQNRYYRGVVIPHVTQGMKDAGMDRSDVYADALPSELKQADCHVYLKTHFAIEDIIDAHGMTRGLHVISTTDMDTKRFATYIDNIKMWAVQYLDTQIPDPYQVR